MGLGAGRGGQKRNPLTPSSSLSLASGYISAGIPSIACIIVFLDALAVSLLVPLLPSYFSSLGCCNEQIAFVTSAYSASQLIGGLILGWASDGHLSRKAAMMISLTGSATAYCMVGFARTVWALVLSRILVGLVKQTMTLSTAILSDLSDITRSERTEHLSRLSAAATVAFIIGSAMGGYLYRRSPFFPPLAASGANVVAALVCLVAVPHDQPHPHHYHHHHHPFYTPSSKKVEDGQDDSSKERPSLTLRQRLSKMWGNFRETLNDSATARILLIRLCYNFLMHALAPANFSGLLESRYGFQKHQLGYITSYKACLSLASQTLLVRYLLRSAAVSEENMARGALFFITLFKALETRNRSQRVYLLASTPLSVMAFSIFDAAIKGIYADTIPEGHKGAALASLGVLQSATGVLAPLYGGEIFQRISKEGDSQQWAMAAHWAGLLILVLTLLHPSWEERGQQRRQLKLKLQQQQQQQQQKQKLAKKKNGDEDYQQQQGEGEEWKEEGVQEDDVLPPPSQRTLNGTATGDHNLRQRRPHSSATPAPTGATAAEPVLVDSSS